MFDSHITAVLSNKLYKVNCRLLEKNESKKINQQKLNQSKIKSNPLLRFIKKTVGSFCTEKLLTIFGPRREKTCLRRFANNTGADQPAHPCSLISAFVIRVLQRTIFKLATSEISFV